MGLVSIPDVQDGDDVNEELFNSRFGAIVSALNGNIDADNLSNNAVTTPKIAPDAVNGSKISSYWGYHQDGTGTNTEYNDLTIDYGWGYLSGTGSETELTEAVTFREDFTSAPIVFVTPGNYSTGTPTSVSDLNGDLRIDWGAYAASITTTGFTAVHSRSTGGYGSPNYAYFWLAIGRR